MDLSMFEDFNEEEWKARIERGRESVERAQEAYRKLMQSSAYRYRDRVLRFALRSRFPRLKHYPFWFLHNVVVHPLLGLAPNKTTVRFHQVTSAWLNKERKVSDRPVPYVARRYAWLLHNVVSHVLIGLLPFKPLFDFHDWSAKRMEIPDWV